MRGLDENCDETIVWTRVSREVARSRRGETARHLTFCLNTTTIHYSSINKAELHNFVYFVRLEKRVWHAALKRLMHFR